jgi:hypothetical protein
MARDYRLAEGKPWKVRKCFSEICFVIFSVAYSLQTGSSYVKTVTNSVPYNI